MTKSARITESSNSDIVQLMHATIYAVQELGGAATSNSIMEKIAELEESMEKMTMQPTKHPRRNFLNKCAWARGILKVYGALNYNPNKKIWNITEFGRQNSDTDSMKDMMYRFIASKSN